MQKRQAVEGRGRQVDAAWVKLARVGEGGRG